MPKYEVTIWFDSDPEPFKREVTAGDVHRAFDLALQDARMGDARGRCETGRVLKSNTVQKDPA